MSEFKDGDRVLVTQIIPIPGDTELGMTLLLGMTGTVFDTEDYTGSRVNPWVCVKMDSPLGDHDDTEWAFFPEELTKIDD